MISFLQMKIIKNKQFHATYLLVIILLLGLFLRIVNLDLGNLSVDEAFSVYYSQYDLKDITKFIYHDTNTVIHFYFLHFWINWFGTTEFVVRGLSVIFGMFSIVLMFLLGKEIFNKKVGLAAAFFTAVSAFHIVYSQEARGFTLLLCLVILSLLFSWKALHKNKNIHWILFITFTVLALYTHHFAWTTLIALNIFTLFSKEFKKFRKKWFLSQFLIFILYLPYLPSIVYSTFRLKFGHWTQFSIPSFITCLDDISYGFIFSNHSSYLLQPIGYLLVIWLLLNTVFVFKIDKLAEEAIIKIKRNKKEITFLFLLYLIPFIISFTTGIHALRYLIVAFPAFSLILAKGFIDLKNHKTKLGVILLLVFLAISSVGGTVDKHRCWSEAIDYIETRESNDSLIIIHEFNHFYEFSYYYKGTSSIFDLLLVDPSVRADKEKLEIERIKHNGYAYLVNRDNVSQLDLITKDYQQVWLVEYNTLLADRFDLTEEYFNKNWQLVEGKVFLFGRREKIKALLYRRNTIFGKTLNQNL